MRHNSFNQVHKGLRALLYDTALKFQQTDLTDTTAGGILLAQLEEVILLFESHAHNEDHFFNEPLEEINEEVAKLFEKEHEEDHRLSLLLQKHMKSWRQAETKTERLQVGTKLFYAFNEFIAFNLYHMNKEETLLNQVLWDTYTDDQIRVTEQQLVQSIAPEKMMKYALWMIRGMNTPEMIHWMKELEKGAPAPVFQIVGAMAKEEWGNVRWKEVEKSLASVTLL